MTDDTFSDSSLFRLARTVGEALLSNKLTAATAESCTGGWIARCLTDIAGSSSWFDRGFVTYSNEAKVDMLGVSLASLENEGAVSAVVAREMVDGVMNACRVDVAVAVTGIAGPVGGSTDKPVGTVYLAGLRRDGPRLDRHYVFEGGRDMVRRRTVVEALGMLRSLASAST
jgi:nicotinamide-nucleotide amidase